MQNGRYGTILISGVVGFALLALSCASTSVTPEKQPAGPAADQPRQGGILTQYFGGDPPSFDLHQESTSAANLSASPAYNQLVIYDPLEPTKVKPDLATSWQVSPDGKTYTFQLAKDVKFHNGNALTAADAKFSLERVMSPPKGIRSPRQGAYSIVERVEAPDDATLRVVLKQPAPSLIMNLAVGYMAVYDKEFAETKGQNAFEKEVMGSGPFRFKEYIRGVSMEVERNKEYWVKDRPYLDGIKIFIIPDRNTALAAFRSGQLHIFSLTADDLKNLGPDLTSKVTVQETMSYGHRGVDINVRKKPFDDPRVRQAVSLAIDRNAALKVLYLGEGKIGGYMPPHGQWGVSPEELAKIPGYGPNKASEIEQAKQLLSEAGFPSGFQTTITTRKLTSYEDVMVFAVDQLAKVGIKAQTKILETTQAYDAMSQGDFELGTWVYGVQTDDPDGIFGEHIICGAVRNYSGFCDKEVDALFNKQSQTLNVEERKKLVQEIERKALTLGGRVILRGGIGRPTLWNEVKNFKAHPDGDNNSKFQDVWMSK